MNAVLTSPEIVFDAPAPNVAERAGSVTAEVSVPRDDQPAQPRSFGGAVWRFLPVSVVAVFVLATFGLSFVTSVAAAAGLAAYLAFWLGAGFGTVAAGVYWALDQNPH